MKRLLLTLVLAELVTGCASSPDSQKRAEWSELYSPSVHDHQWNDEIENDDNATEVPHPPSHLVHAADPNDKLSVALGMNRSPADLGFTEKTFDPCHYGVEQESCKSKYLTIVHFQLLCRETDGSVSIVPRRLLPITSRDVRWKIGNQAGHTQTDAWGYGQLSAVSRGSIRGQRLILQIGSRFVGFTASEVNKIVLPKNFCHG